MKLPLSIAILLLLCLQARAQLPSKTVEPGQDLLYCYSNGRGTFYCGPLSGDNASGFHGITQHKRKLFEQYWIQLGDVVLDRSTAECTVTPAGLQRRYPLFNTVEDVFFADSLTLLSVRVKTDWSGDVRVYPALAQDWASEGGSIRGGTFMLEKHQRIILDVQGLDGGWERARPRDVERLSSPAPMNVPAMYWGSGKGAFGFTFECLPLEAAPAMRPEAELANLQLRKESRIEALLKSAEFSCSDDATTEAFHWILASMDALLVRAPEMGIWAGLPWFDDLWGRDTFISLPGALLSTGRFDEALRVLESFAARMDTARTSLTYGRIPNRVQPGEVIYNTVDGTPWMMLSLWKYYEYSGDRAALRRLFPVVQASINGSLARTDGRGLLRHADAETWMDAVGMQGPWSPRGDRAIEIQALWLTQLRASANIARAAGRPELADAWANVHARRVEAALKDLYVNPATRTLIDHINSDNSADTRIRPNSLLAFSLPCGREAACPAGVEDSTLLRIFSECVFPWGVASLSARDENFHPFHEAPRNYPKDAAYHNGTIWTWLSGPAIDLLCRHGLVDDAWKLTESLHRLCMESGAVGTIPECTDALPHAGNEFPRWSGTFSQAWSNAEYLRVMYERYLGARVTQEAQPVIEFAPHLPAALDRLAASVRTSSGRLHIAVERESSGKLRCTFTSSATTPILLRSPAGDERGSGPVWRSGKSFGDVLLPPGGKLEITLQNAKAAGSAFARNFRFAEQSDPAGYTALAPPDHPMLPDDEVTARNESAPQLCSVSDPSNDDTGPEGGFTYPRNLLFKAGILDLLSADVRADEDRLFFTIRMRALTQPGWHPEYGFQLTMLAIAVDRRRSGSEAAAREIGHNSGYVLPEDAGYTHLVLVGGGIEVRDASGTILAAYIPETSAGAFGDVRNGEIRFSLPLGLFGAKDAPWRFVIAAGAQDDHGGAGIGEFRSVLTETAEWNGGGAIREGVNWYDDLHCP